MLPVQLCAVARRMSNTISDAVSNTASTTVKSKLQTGTVLLAEERQDGHDGWSCIRQVHAICETVQKNSKRTGPAKSRVNLELQSALGICAAPK